MLAVKCRQSNVCVWLCAGQLLFSEKSIRFYWLAGRRLLFTKTRAVVPKNIGQFCRRLLILLLLLLQKTKAKKVVLICDADVFCVLNTAAKKAKNMCTFSSGCYSLKVIEMFWISFFNERKEKKRRRKEDTICKTQFGLWTDLVHTFFTLKTSHWCRQRQRRRFLYYYFFLVSFAAACLFSQFHYQNYKTKLGIQQQQQQQLQL